MRLLIGHNYYQQSGGEDFLFKTQTKMLKDFGHEICLYERHNNEIKPDLLAKLRQSLELRWSTRSYDEIRQLIRSFKPQLVHFHNTFYVTTPSVIYACRDEGVPVVLSLHNFRLMCVNGLFFRDNKPCEDCLTKGWTQGIVHQCYRHSYFSSAMAADMVQYHWRRQTWTQHVDQFIVATDFSRQKHIKAGIPADKISVLPHSVESPASVVDAAQRGGYALYAGRLSEEKGIDFLIKAWEGMTDIPLYVMGTGPRKEAIEQLIKDRGYTHIKMLGFMKRDEYVDVMSKANFLIVPSLCYDNFPMVVAEAYSYGVPVVASRLGTLVGCVDEGINGMLFEANQAEDLRAKCRQLMGDTTKRASMSAFARQKYEHEFTPAINYQALTAIYARVVKER